MGKNMFATIAIIITLTCNTIGFAQSSIRGLNYGPFRDGQSPDALIFPTHDQLAQDVSILSQVTRAIRLYSTCNGFADVIPLGAAASLQVIPGAFLRSTLPNNVEITCLINAINQNIRYRFPFAVVGSEAVSANGIQPGQLIGFIGQVRAGTGNSVAIATAEFWQTWLSTPSLAAAVDVILVNVYPYYECGTSSPPPLSVCTSIEGAVDYVIQRVRQVEAAYPGKAVLIGETGWPSAGEPMGQAVASLENEEAYAAGILERTAADGIGLLYFEAFDEAWKGSPGAVNQAHFGLFTSQRNGNSAVPKGSVNNTCLFETAGSTKGDFNRDGRSDILWRNNDGEVVVWELNGASVIGGGNLPNPGPGWQIVGTGDFNGDGSSDILWQHCNGSVAIWELNGANVIGGGSLPDPGPSWHAKGIGDFSGDGFSDILWQNDDGTVAVWEMNGTAVIGGGSLPNPGPGWHIQGTGDFNGDGLSDVLWQNDSGQIVIWEMNGRMVIGGGNVGNPGPSWHVEGIGEFNGDGRSDILWQNDSGQVVIWEMNGTTFIGGGNVANPGPSWHVEGIGDFNADGRSDILWRNDDGEVALWELNGTIVIGGGSLPNPGLSWRLF